MRLRSSIFILLISAARVFANDSEFAEQIGFEQRIDRSIPLDLMLRDEAGAAVQLHRYFGEQPVILALVYYECPMLCNEVMNGVNRTLKAIAPRAGKDFQVVIVSFDPRETPELAAKKKRNYVAHSGNPETATGWHCLTGDSESIRQLTEAVGFRYRYDERIKQFAHAAGIVVLTPKGKISRYFFGIDYPPKELQIALAQARDEKPGPVVHQLLLLCYNYDPATGKYGFAIMKTLRVAGAITAGGLFAGIVFMLRGDRRKPSRRRLPFIET